MDGINTWGDRIEPNLIELDVARMHHNTHGAGSIVPLIDTLWRTDS
jgi:hypothetical protein